MKIVRRLSTPAVAALLVLAIGPAANRGRAEPRVPAASVTEQEHAQWVEKCYVEIDTVKIGMPKPQFLKIFENIGGVSDGRTYSYRKCPYFQLHVDFDESGRISQVSKPYLNQIYYDCAAKVKLPRKPTREVYYAQRFRHQRCWNFKRAKADRQRLLG